eukprot:COSAG05_NODE_5891_length_1065_cov_0.788820_1_plen_224_part_00
MSTLEFVANALGENFAGCCYRVMGWTLIARYQRGCFRCLQHSRWESEAETDAHDTDNEAGFHHKDEQIKSLVDLTAKYEAFKKDANFVKNSTFADEFVPEERPMVYMWMGTLRATNVEEGAHASRESQLEPLSRFQQELAQQDLDQLWACVPDVIRALIFHCCNCRQYVDARRKQLYENSGNLDATGNRLGLRETIGMEMSEINSEFVSKEEKDRGTSPQNLL